MGSHPKRGKPGGIEETRANIRAQLDEGWAKTRLAQLELEKADAAVPKTQEAGEEAAGPVVGRPGARDS